MNRTVAIDTNIISAIMRNNTDNIAATLDTITDILVPSTVYAEVLGGLHAGNDPLRHIATFEAFLAEPTVTVHDVAGAEVAREYAKLYAYLRSHGTPISPNDIWIAAECITARIPLYTLDSDFAHLPQLTLYASEEAPTKDA